MSTHYNLSLGTVLNGRYKILSVLGPGGFGITYRCEHIVLKQIVCIKELFISGHCTRGSGNTVQSQGLKKQDFSYYRDKFIEEARQLVRFRHPGIVQVQDVFEEHGTAYYAMEFIEGETLLALVTRKKQLPVEDMLRITGSLLDAVEVLHRADPPLLHRDIKPANIMLRPDGSPVLIDFGSAREYREGISISHSEILTPGYAPLEQYEPKAKRGAYTDVYSIGATMYVMLTGKKPYDAPVRASNALKKLHDMPAPAILNPDIPEWISAAVMKALAIVSEDRYQSVAELRAALQVHKINPLQEARQALKALKDQTQHTAKMHTTATAAERLLQRYEGQQGADWEVWRRDATEFSYTCLRSAADIAFSRKRFTDAKQYYERALLHKPDCTHSRSRLEAIAAIEPKAKTTIVSIGKQKLLIAGGLGVLLCLFGLILYKVLPVQSPQTGILVLHSDAPCTVRVNGADTGKIMSDADSLLLSIKAGAYNVQFISLESESVQHSIMIQAEPGIRITRKIALKQLFEEISNRHFREQVFRDSLRADSLNRAELALQRRIAETKNQQERERLQAEQNRLEEERRVLEIRSAALAEKERQRKETIIRSLQNNMVFVQGGTFTMGCTSEQGSDCYDDEKPAHQVTLSSFKMGKYEVTREEWEVVMESNLSSFPYCPKCPVENVFLGDIEIFLRRLNNMTSGNYRLPTEAEWEFAARGGKSSNFKYSGSNNLNDLAWYNNNSGGSAHIVGQKQANTFGLFDMSGNVREWCSDWKGGYSSSPQKNPRGSFLTPSHVIRGGCWFDGASHCRVSYRSSNSPGNRGNSAAGFRLVSQEL